MNEGKDLKQLGSNDTNYTYDNPDADILETFENKASGNDYSVNLTAPEFTSLCPKTGQPDFAVIDVVYVPDKKCIETKSFKLYLFAYRNYGSFMESITNKILNDLVYVCSPKSMSVLSTFNIRGGIELKVRVGYEK